ncbi:MipA/OmpV family protein [Bordetella sp. 2513F-2]
MPILCGVLIAPVSAFAADPDGPESTTWGIGLGVAGTQKAYTDIDREYTPIPLLRYENKYLRFFGTTLEAKLPGLTLSESQELRFGLIARYDGAGYEADDSWALDGMDERKGGFWAGAKIEWRSDIVNLHAEWTHDISGHSKGQSLSLGAERTWQLSQRLSLTPRVGATWHDDKYVDYYYGVRAHEALAWRPAYEGKSGFDTEVGLQAVYDFNKHHSVMLDLQLTRLSSDAKDSPLVDRSTENRVFLGYMYRF